MGPYPSHRQIRAAVTTTIPVPPVPRARRRPPDNTIILLFSITSTFLYFQQVQVVSHVFADRGAQTAFFATLDLVVNCLTLALQLFFTGRIVVLLGVALALALLPALTIVGFGSLVASDDRRVPGVAPRRRLTGPMRPRLPSMTLSSRERPGSATAASAH